MLYKTKHLLASTALMVCMMQATPSFSETITHETTKETVTTTTRPETTKTEMTWETVEHSLPATGARIINFMDFDLNKDSILSINEIGKMLFKLYDTDGNEIIDNVEFERRAVVTVMPMHKDTVIYYDFDGDGRADVEKHTYETFLKDTLLTRFDKNMDGLSPHEFTGLYFISADVNHDKAIDLKEWQGSYNATIDKANKSKARFNK
jgi:hypothetical protein